MKGGHGLNLYFDEINGEEPLTPDEEVEIAIKVKQGDKEALDKLLKSNLKFVITVARKYQGRGLSLEELINEGNLGLIKAANRFDVSRGFKFISYAVWWIRQSILQALSEQLRVVRLPLNVIGSINRVKRTMVDFERDYEREPTAYEIEEILKQENINVDEVRQLSERHLSIDTPIKEDGSGTLGDILPDGGNSNPDTGLMAESLHQEIMNILKSLDKREAVVIKQYFGLGGESPLSLEEIGENLKLTRERVRQIKEKALRKLRHSSRALILKGYLG